MAMRYPELLRAQGLLDVRQRPDAAHERMARHGGDNVVSTDLGQLGDAASPADAACR